MDRAFDAAQTAADAGQPSAVPPEGDQPELDLQRLVWDPEYREAMRRWLGRGR